MLFKTLKLNNFRVFCGETSIDLAPRKKGVFDRPVVLFGGLNGAGKTSILTAIRLALFGRRALGAAMSKKDFHSYLSEQINQTALQTNPTADALVSLCFTHTHQGEHNLFTIQRSWNLNSEEQLSLSINDEPQSALSVDAIQAFLSEIVPPGIGDLFFFDGEKIAELAEDDTGSYLKEAVQKLLGLDVISRLETDLEIYLSDNSKLAADKEVLNKIEAAEFEKRRLADAYESVRQEAESISAPLVETQTKIALKQLEIAALDNGDSEQQRDKETIYKELIARKNELETELRQEYSGYLPMALAPTAMQSLFAQLEKDQQVKQAHAFGTQLSQNLPGLEKLLKNQFAEQSDQINASIQRYFGQLINQTALVKPKLDISDSDFALLKVQFTEAQQTQKKSDLLQLKIEAVKEQLENLAYTAVVKPDAAEVKQHYEALLKLQLQREQLSRKYLELMKSAKELKEKELQQAKVLEKHFSTLKNKSSNDKAELRVSATLSALTEFKTELTELRVKQLEQLFVQSYRKLARKEDLKLSARINPATYDVHLIDDKGAVINRKSMSAGEKQIFAFAILEALGKLSGKVLPVVVDTPLGRLDSKHRQKLVQNYFPEASEQVILLSTDTEVDASFYHDLQDSISHAFEIEFDQRTRSSTLKEGYFWAEPTQEAV